MQTFTKTFDALAILGPTASGKTALALSLAQFFPIEIISMDSALVYREMDIGTAKPTVQELLQVPHHLINIRNPDETYNTADFSQATQALIVEIVQRGAVPVIVGGTMMYYRALTQGLDTLPQADPQLRQRLEVEAAGLGWPALHQRLSEVDPQTSERLSPNDAQRIQRALEVFELTGQPLSAFFGRAATGPSLQCLSLEPQDRAQLHVRIAQRFTQMLKAGLVDEVLQLRSRWHLHPSMPAMRCVGYRQVWEMLEGLLPVQALSDRGVFATRQLAKRQLTWLRAIANRQVFDPFDLQQSNNALDYAKNFCSVFLSC